MRIPPADRSKASYSPSGRSWNAMRDEATRASRITVGGNLSMINTPTGVVIFGNDSPSTNLVMAVCNEPLIVGGATDMPYYKISLFEPGLQLHTKVVDIYNSIMLKLRAFNAIGVNMSEVAGHNTRPPIGCGVIGFQIGTIKGESDDDPNKGLPLIAFSYGIPAPDRLYDMLQPRDDTLRPTWGAAEVQA